MDIDVDAVRGEIVIHVTYHAGNGPPAHLASVGVWRRGHCVAAGTKEGNASTSQSDRKRLWERPTFSQPQPPMNF